MSESPKKRGRPPATHKGTAALTWLSEAEYDQLIELARIRRCSVSLVLRLAAISLIEKYRPIKPIGE